MDSVKISRALTLADEKCDYIPIISTISTCVNVFIKYVVLPWVDPATVKGNLYLKHIHYKEFSWHVVAFIPVGGNVMLYLTRKYHSKTPLLAAIEKCNNRFAVRDLCRAASKELKDDPDVARAFVSKSPDVFEYLSEEQRNSVEIGLIASKHKKHRGVALRYGGPNCQDHEELVRQVFAEARTGRLFKFASLRLRSDREIVKIAITNESSAMRYVDDSLKSDPEIQALYESVRKREQLRAKERNNACGEKSSKRSQFDKAILDLKNAKDDALKLGKIPDQLKEMAEIILNGIPSPRSVMGFDAEEKITKQQLDKKYRQLSLKCHPDRNPTNEVFAKSLFECVKSAKECLELTLG
jgi:hypothetical protein